MRNRLEIAAFWLTGAAAAAGLFSIAVSHILLGLAFVTLLASGVRLRLPPVWIPLSLFILGTLASLAASPDPLYGRPQLRKFYVFLFLVCVYSLIRRAADARRLLMVLAGAATISALRSLVQFSDKMDRARELGRGFYEFYVADRITGFMSHWMTFSGEMMIALLVTAALLFFSPAARDRPWLWLACGLALSGAIALGFTRGIWVGTAAGGLYLMWFWRRRLVLVAPLVALAGFWVLPGFLRARVTSFIQPHGEVDSNLHRAITLRTGLRMIQAHPWLGLGPEIVKRDFLEWVPSDVKLPSGWYGHLHNIYVHYAAERGIPTMLALMWMLGRMLWDLARAARAAPGPGDERSVLEASVAVIIAVLVVGFFEVNLGDSEVLGLFLTVVACGYVARDALQTSHVPAEVES